MARTPNLLKRGAVYYLNIRVPKDVRDDFGRDFVRESLGERDISRARTKSRRRIAELEEQWQEFRDDVSLTRRKADAIISPWQLQLLQKAELAELPKFDRDDPDGSFAEYQTEMHELAGMLTELHNGGGETSSNYVYRTVHQLLLDNGFRELPSANNDTSIQPSQRSAFVDTGSPEYLYFEKRVVEALKAIWRIKLLRFRGRDPMQAALNPIQPATVSETQVTLSELIQQFREQKEREQYGKRKLLAYNVVGEIMIEVFGGSKVLNDITNQECRRLVEVLKNIPSNARKKLGHISYVDAAQLAVESDLTQRSNSTVQSDIHSVSAIFNWAIDQGMLEKNPMPRRNLPSRSKVRADQQRQAFSFSDIAKIFADDVFTKPGSQNNGASKQTPARFWIPLLSLYHGCRLNELCQLYVDDVIVDHSIPYIAIRQGRNDQRLKTQWSERNVPIHPTLQEIGFLDFVRQQQSTREGLLFDELNLCSRGYYSSSYQKWFNRVLLRTEVKRPRISFHSFRHSFRNACRRAEIPIGVVCAIGGWKPDGIHNLYGDHALALLAEQIAKIDYGLNCDLFSWGN